MNGINKVILVGNVGNDPEIKRLETGTPVAKIRIATTEYYRNRNGERMESTEWHSVTLWRSLAELAEKYLHKGSKVYVEGKLRNREFEDREGHRRKITEIEAENIIIFDKRNGGRPGPAGGRDESGYMASDVPPLHDEYGPAEPGPGFEPESGEEPMPY
ncbi:MAG: single-stranded DNA-binding protein [Flavobacteriales bacterium]|nr:single-stranded DNA-binding protein [Flavobacteriales bacterium]